MQNPHIPAMHFNTRYICTTQNWFGGGMDVTPSIKDANEKNKFHKTLKIMCDRHNKKFYKKYKKWCDEYFYLPHRNESRGIGGIFFDYKKDNFEKDFNFVRDVGVTFQMLFNKIIENLHTGTLACHKRINYFSYLIIIICIICIPILYIFF